MGFRSGELGSQFGGSVKSGTTIILHLSEVPCLQAGDVNDAVSSSGCLLKNI